MEIMEPRRVSRSYEQMINGSAEAIFPLYCPVKETLWCEGWDPVAVYSVSGVMEKGCVFVTEENGVESTWVVTAYDLEDGLVEIVKQTPGVTVSILEIRIRPVSENRTRARITYTLTALGPEGDKILAGFTRERYGLAMDAWEKAMNHYLATGEVLTGLHRF